MFLDQFSKFSSTVVERYKPIFSYNGIRFSCNCFPFELIETAQFDASVKGFLYSHYFCYSVFMN
jgi:hypothetical protein